MDPDADPLEHVTRFDGYLFGLHSALPQRAEDVPNGFYVDQATQCRLGDECACVSLCEFPIGVYSMQTVYVDLEGLYDESLAFVGLDGLTVEVVDNALVQICATADDRTACMDYDGSLRMGWY